MTPPDPLTPMAEAAAQLHEVYLGLQAGGFTPQEALMIVCDVLARQLGR